jgi:hypothetical protein
VRTQTAAPRPPSGAKSHFKPNGRKSPSKAAVIGYHEVFGFFEIRFSKNTICVIVSSSTSSTPSPRPMALRFETARSARPPAPPNCPAGGRLPTTCQPDRRKSESGARAFSMRPIPRSGRANPAAIAALPAERIRSQMAPQRLEKIESAPRNGMAPETPDPQHLVQERLRRLAEHSVVAVARDECSALERGTEIFLPAKP